MNSLKTTMLMAILTAIFMAVGRSLGGESGMILAFGIATLTNFFSYWFSDKIVLKMYGAKEVNEASAPELYQMVQALAAQANLPMPRVYIIRDPSPNAFATGRNPEHAAIAVTEGIMEILSPN